jgi:hypothetical protein
VAGSKTVIVSVEESVEDPPEVPESLDESSEPPPEHDRQSRQMIKAKIKFLFIIFSRYFY